MASSAAPFASTSTEKSCVCDTISLPSQPAPITAKCKACRTKPRFAFLRGQRSLDLGQQGPSATGLNAHTTSEPPSRSKEAEVMQNSSRAPPQGRRARSAERYEGLRINDRTASGLPRQTSLQTPMISNMSAPSDRPPEYYSPISSPPPPYQVAIGKMGYPPTYEEYLAQQLQNQKQSMTSSTPPPLPPRNPPEQSRYSSPPPPWSVPASSTAASQSLLNCSECKKELMSRGSTDVLRVNLPPEQDTTPNRDTIDAQRMRRLMLATEKAQQPSSSHNHCPCAKCQSRYETYDDSYTNDEFSLDSTMAIQGTLGVGLGCSVM